MNTSDDATKILNTGTPSKSEVKKLGTTSNTSADSWATLSMVFGILSVVGGFSGLIALAFGIIGLIFANNAKQLGYDDLIRKVGFWTSLVGVILSGISLLGILFVLLWVGFGFLASILSIIFAFAAALKGLVLIL